MIGRWTLTFVNNFKGNFVGLCWWSKFIGSYLWTWNTMLCFFTCSGPKVFSIQMVFLPWWLENVLNRVNFVAFGFLQQLYTPLGLLDFWRFKIIILCWMMINLFQKTFWVSCVLLFWVSCILLFLFGWV